LLRRIERVADRGGRRGNADAPPFFGVCAYALPASVAMLPANVACIPPATSIWIIWRRVMPRSIVSISCIESRGPIRCCSFLRSFMAFSSARWWIETDARDNLS
jgi:hypothetical protein